MALCNVSRGLRQPRTLVPYLMSIDSFCFSSFGILSNSESLARKQKIAPMNAYHDNPSLWPRSLW